MENMDKLIKGFECHYVKGVCLDCPYEQECEDDNPPSYQIAVDVLEVLKEKQKT